MLLNHYYLGIKRYHYNVILLICRLFGIVFAFNLS